MLGRIMTLRFLKLYQIAALGHGASTKPWPTKPWLISMHGMAWHGFLGAQCGGHLFCFFLL